MLWYPNINKRSLSEWFSICQSSTEVKKKKKQPVNAFRCSSSCKLNSRAWLDSKHLIIPHHWLFPNWTRSHCSGRKKNRQGPFSNIYPVGRVIPALARWANIRRRKTEEKKTIVRRKQLKINCGHNIQAREILKDNLLKSKFPNCGVTK